MTSPRKLSKVMLLCLLSVVFVSSVHVAFGAGQPVTFTLQTSTTETPQNHPITLTATMSAPVSGAVRLQWDINSSGFLFNYDWNITNGSASREFGFGGGTGNWTFRVLWLGDGVYNAATTNVVSVNVLPAQYEDETDYTLYIVAGVVAVVVILGFLIYSRRTKKQSANPT